MSEVIVHEPAPLGQQIEFAKALAPSGLLPREYQQNPANLLFALQYADALDVKPIHAITSIHVINGKPSASAELIASVVRRAGHKLRVTADDQEATAVLIRADDQGFEYTATWDLKRAQTAGLTSNPTWKKFPAAMLRSRAITEVCRMGASDALYGVTHTPDELGGEFTDAPEAAPSKPAGPTTKVSRKRKDPAPVAETKGQDDLRAAIAETGEVPSEAQLRKMFAVLKENGLEGRDEALGYVSSVIGRDIESRSELTRPEISKVLDSFTPAPEEN
ncbi:hypothetical protein C1N80_06330 [Brachybacterium sp. SGAir0954]|uniref:recombinase RecT n=1 Tax=Brachybacterium sp. SGAir0954 TaxID=2571029 RepID=UPI0010CCDD99|nr:recombinase RecT [Brachybacterium sp. SGAir0954]QCR53237.1 hypothetical protein C1N80_06330 [Brachybacterium sp. SGAir0954]